MADRVAALGERICSVAIGELVVSSSPEDVLVAYGLGSCVVVALYDSVAHLGGMIHALLPTMPQNKNPALPEMPARFVEQGVPLLLDRLTRRGAARARLQGYLCGGARILTAPGFPDWLAVGERNVQAAEQALRVAGIPLRGQATRGTRGRTVKLYIADGRITVRTLGTEEEHLA
ncbi:MAG: chemotaxis protein CheD [Ardenticatenales bacterium]|nr:chemotaxis protein CheD [Ardenticatenales bacterium]